MHSFASSWHLWANPSLLSNGRIPNQGGTHLPQGFKTPQLSLKMPWHYICEHIWQRKLAALSCNLPLSATNCQDCLKGTKLLLHLLWEAGYKVSWKKAQICLDRVKYLRFHITQSQQSLSTEKKQAICSIPTPTMRRQICEFLGAAGFCRIWTPNFSLLANPLYKATKGGKREPLNWKSKQ
jgi:hypothetical protein